MIKSLYEGDVYSGSCPFSPVTDSKRSSDWTVSPEGTDAGRAFIDVLEVLPSKTGDPVVIYRQRYETPDGDELATSWARKLCRQNSLLKKINSRGLSLIEGQAAA